jgi:hypothetical protein
MIHAKALIRIHVNVLQMSEVLRKPNGLLGQLLIFTFAGSNLKSINAIFLNSETTPVPRDVSVRANKF